MKCIRINKNFEFELDIDKIQVFLLNNNLFVMSTKDSIQLK